MNSERGPSGFNINLRWSDIIAYIAFFAVIAPAIYFAGVLTERMTDVETLAVEHGKLPGHGPMETRMAVIESQIALIPEIERKLEIRLTAIEAQIATLPGIERKIDELLKKRREGP